MANPASDNITTAFQQLSWLPAQSTVEATLSNVENFVTSVFKSDSQGLFINEARYQMFSSSVSGNLRDLPLAGML